MADIILHQYPLSPYSEKVRLAMGLKGLSWRSVEIPVWTPRPLLTPMTGGYRRTPILQIGADFYCDTLLILHVLDGLGTANSLYPVESKAMVKACCWWIEKSSFWNSVCLTIGNLAGKLPQELIDERKPFFGASIDPAELQPKRGVYSQRLNAHLHWLGQLLADGRPYVFGSQATAADLAAYHVLWFARQNGGPEIEALLPISTVGAWYDRVGAIGHGRPTSMTPEEAIQVAKVTEPDSPKASSREAESVGVRPGDWVSVTPDDYGNPVHGRLLAWMDEEIVIRHEDRSVGRVNLHFPRAGFDIIAERQAA
ncbi:MAG: glutathione S-transferase family protein [Burkholderiales bacterium]